MNRKYNDYFFTNKKSGNSCIVIDAQPEWKDKQNELIERFKEMERELGVSEFDISLITVPKSITFKAIRNREVLKNLWPKEDGIDLVYLGGKRELLSMQVKI